MFCHFPILLLLELPEISVRVPIEDLSLEALVLFPVSAIRKRNVEEVQVEDIARVPVRSPGGLDLLKDVLDGVFAARPADDVILLLVSERRQSDLPPPSARTQDVLCTLAEPAGARLQGSVVHVYAAGTVVSLTNPLRHGRDLVS